MKLLTGRPRYAIGSDNRFGRLEGHKMRFTMAQRGSVFCTPERAIRLLTELERAEAGRRRDPELVLDFSDVTRVSPSFANGFVGAVIDKRRALDLPDPELDGTSPFVKKVIDRALSERESQLHKIALAS